MKLQNLPNSVVFPLNIIEINRFALVMFVNNVNFQKGEYNIRSIVSSSSCIYRPTKSSAKNIISH